MTLTKEQQHQLLEAAKPLIAWMNNNCHPHCTASVDQRSVKVDESIAMQITDEYLQELFAEKYVVGPNGEMSVQHPVTTGNAFRDAMRDNRGIHTNS